MSKNPVLLELQPSDVGIEAVITDMLDKHLLPAIVQDDTQYKQGESAEAEFHRLIAQDAFDKGIEYWTSAKMDQAMEAFQSSLEMRESVLGTYHKDTAKSYLWVGAVHWNLGDHIKSLDSLCRSYRITISMANGDPQACCIVSNWISRVLDDALFRSLLRDKLEYFKLFQSSVSHELRGDRMAQKGKYLEAIQEYRTALNLELRRRHFIARDAPSTSFRLSESPVVDVADIQSRIAAMYDVAREYDRAMLYYRKSLSIYLAKFGRAHPLTMNAYEQISRVCLSKGWSDATVNEYLSVLFDSIVHEITADMLVDRKGYTLALQKYNAAIQLEEKYEVGKLQLACANMYVKVAKLRTHQCPKTAHVTALPYYCRALGIYEVTFGSSHPDTKILTKAIRSLFVPTNGVKALVSREQEQDKEPERQPSSSQINAGKAGEQQFEELKRHQDQQPQRTTNEHTHQYITASSVDATASGVQEQREELERQQEKLKQFGKNEGKERLITSSKTHTAEFEEHEERQEADKQQQAPLLHFLDQKAQPVGAPWQTESNSDKKGQEADMRSVQPALTPQSLQRHEPDSANELLSQREVVSSVQEKDLNLAAINAEEKRIPIETKVVQETSEAEGGEKAGGPLEAQLATAE